MNCPKPDRLAALLTDEGFTPSNATPTNDALWSHVELCSHCQTVLQSLDDQTKLSALPDSAIRKNVDLGGSDPKGDCAISDELRQSLVARILMRTDPQLQNADSQSDDYDQTILSAFRTSEYADDLGRFHHYRIVKLMGRGGMSLVFEAIDCSLNRKVALKILRPTFNDNASLRRFRREAHSLARVVHPHVIAIFAVSKDSDRPAWLAMEHVEGESLRQVLNRSQVIEPRIAAEWIAQAAHGLSAVHVAGLIHRDVKPSNILLQRAGDQIVAKLADFGLSRPWDLSSQDTHTAILMGTPSYMSPEQIRDQINFSPASDIYSLGVSLYESLTGQSPFQGDVSTILRRISTETPKPARKLNANIPIDLETICSKAMHREPSQRYSSSREFAEDLERWIRREPIVAKPPSRLEQATRWVARNRRVAVLAASIALLIVSMMGLTITATLGIRSANTQLLQKNQVVENTNHQLQDSISSANKQRQIAIDSLDNLINSVQAELSKHPGTLPTREAILESALQSLEKLEDRQESGQDVLEETTDSFEVDSRRILANLRKGQVLEALGRTDEAIACIRSSVRFAQSLSDRNQRNGSASYQKSRSLYAEALSAQAEFTSRKGALVEALASFKTLQSMQEELRNSFPEDQKLQEDLAMTLQRIGDLHSFQNQWDQSREAQAESVAILDRILVPNRNDPRYLRLVSTAIGKLGNVEELCGMESDAFTHIEKAVGLADRLRQLEPETKTSKLQSLFVQSQFVRLLSSRDQHEKALRQANSIIEDYSSLCQADPEDLSLEINLGLSWLSLHNAQLAAGDLANAENAIVKSIEIDRELAERDPTTSKYCKHGSDLCLLLFDDQLRQGKLEEAVATLHLADEFLEKCLARQDANQFLIRSTQQIQKLLLDGLELSTFCLRKADLSELEKSEPREELPVARIFCMYELARRGDVDQAVEIGKLITENPTQVPLVNATLDVVTARSYALCIEHIEREQGEPREESNKSANAFDSCIRYLKRAGSFDAAKANPSMVRSLKKERDFRSIVHREEFLALLGVFGTNP